MLHFTVFVKRISRARAVPCLSRIPVPPPLSYNSHGIISLADPHHLNYVVSYRYKNMGAGSPQISYRSPQSSIFRTLFQVPYPVSLAFATLTKTAGVYTTILVLDL